MNEFLMQSAAQAEAEDLDIIQTLISDAAKGQRSIMEELLDSKLLNEEMFMESLSRQMRMPWESDLRPRNSRRLKEICSAHIALRHRLLPLWFGESDPGMPFEEGDGEPSAEVPPPDASDAENLDLLPPSQPPPLPLPHASNKLRLVLVTYDPFNLQARQAVTQAIPYPIQWHMASRTRVLHSIQKLYGVGADTFDAILRGRDMNDTSAMDIREETTVLDEDDEEASVVKFVNAIIRQALQQRATDIHVEPLDNNLRIRYRIDGLLVDVPVPENINALQAMVIARLKIMSRLDIAERRLPQDGRISLELEGQGIDVRVATIPTVQGESVALRLLNQQKFNLDKLGLLPAARKIVNGLLKLNNGIILITGPTGSGKSTSLYTFLSELNTTDTRIVTVEDPVENKIEGVMQIAVKPEINLTFASGLRSILRADPDIVMVGEMRDLETAEIAIRAALTGHLVFSTLHTNDAIAGITRLVDMGVEPFLVSASVRCFLAQRLVRRLCQRCRVPTPTTMSILRELGYSGPPASQTYEAKPRGCDHCNHTGFYGRLAIYEVAVVTKRIQDLIVKRASEAELKEMAIKEGFMQMRDYGLHKVLEGETTLEEVVSVTTSDMAVVDD